jgi:hypothetical protein
MASSSGDIPQTVLTLHILSTLLSLHDKQQTYIHDVSTTSGEIVTPQQLSAGGAVETLKRAFLYWSADVLSPKKGGKDVTATGLKEPFLWHGIPAWIRKIANYWRELWESTRNAPEDGR